MFFGYAILRGGAMGTKLSHGPSFPLNFLSKVGTNLTQKPQMAGE